jgi:hypothetical protein
MGTRFFFILISLYLASSNYFFHSRIDVFHSVGARLLRSSFASWPSNSRSPDTDGTFAPEDNLRKWIRDNLFIFYILFLVSIIVLLFKMLEKSSLVYAFVVLWCVTQPAMKVKVAERHEVLPGLK